MSTSSSMSQQIAQVKAASAARLPEHVREVFLQQIAANINAGAPADLAALDTEVPDLALIAPDGTRSSLSHAMADKPAVLVFYRGAWCPYCNVALRVYGQDLFPELQAHGIALVAISPQTTDGSLSMQEKHELAFPVLSDPGNRLASFFGIVMAPRSQELRSAQEEMGADVPGANFDGTEDVPIATVAILTPERRLRWLDVRPDHTARTDVPEILAALAVLN